MDSRAGNRVRVLAGHLVAGRQEEEWSYDGQTLVAMATSAQPGRPLPGGGAGTLKILDERTGKTYSVQARRCGGASPFHFLGSAQARVRRRSTTLAPSRRPILGRRDAVGSPPGPCWRLPVMPCAECLAPRTVCRSRQAATTTACACMIRHGPLAPHTSCSRAARVFGPKGRLRPPRRAT